MIALIIIGSIALYLVGAAGMFTLMTWRQCGLDDVIPLAIFWPIMLPLWVLKFPAVKLGDAICTLYDKILTASHAHQEQEEERKRQEKERKKYLPLPPVREGGNYRLAPHDRVTSQAHWWDKVADMIKKSHKTY